MKEHPVDRSDWPSGPWDDEPTDREQWRTETGLPGLIVRNGMGAWCGYVAVEADHQFFEIDYQQCAKVGGTCEDGWCSHSPEALVDVHGGLTYSDKCREDTPICHIPEPGESDDVWWLGFDTAHAGDLIPGCLSHYRGTRYEYVTKHDTYRDRDYVRAEVENLARQLVVIDRPAIDAAASR